MTILNVISILGALLFLVAAIVAYRAIKQSVADADGLIGLNEHGKTGESEEGDCIGELGGQED